MFPEISTTIPTAFFFKEIDPLRQAFIDKFNSILDDIKSDIIGLQYLLDPEKAPSTLLSELAYYLAADILADDSDQQIRFKILNAVQFLRKRDLWEVDIKLRIDQITGFSASIYRGFADTGDWIFMGAADDQGPNDWACFGGDGSTPFGLDLIGFGTEVEVTGNLYIDLGNDSIPSPTIDRVRGMLSVYANMAYLNLILGYTVAGVFVEY